MKALILTLALIRLVTMPADGQDVVLPVLSTLQPKPIKADTVTFVITRSELMKLELARRTLASLDFTDIDQVITTQKTVIDECEKTLNEIVKTSTQTIRDLQDSLTVTRSIIQRSSQTNERISTTVSQTHVRLSNLNAIVKDAKRFVWVQRVAAFAVGIGVGVVLPPVIKLISSIF